MIITSFDYHGNDILLNTEAVISIVEAGKSSQWHGIRSVIHLMDGRAIECGESVNSLKEKLNYVR